MDIVKVTQICAVISIRATVIGREWLNIITEHADFAMDFFVLVFALYTLRAIIETGKEISELVKPHALPQSVATTSTTGNDMPATKDNSPVTDQSADK